MTDLATAKDALDKKMLIIGLLIFIISSLFYCYSFAVQVMPSAISHNLIHDFAISTTTFGIFSSSFYWLYTSAQIPAGLLIDRFGSRTTLSLATLICGIGTIMFGLTHYVSIAILGRCLEGASAAFSFVGVIYLILRWFPPAMLAMLVGVLQLTASIGAISGGSMLASLLEHHHWRVIAVSTGCLGIAIACITFLVVRNQPAGARQENITEHSEFNMLQSMYIVLNNPQTWYIALYAFCIWGTTLAFAALWGIPFLKTSLHVSTFYAANAIAIIWIGIGIGSPLIGWISDKIKKRRLPLIITALLGLICMSGAIYIPHIPKLLLFILLFGIGLALSAQTLTFGVVKDNNPIDTTGTANGFNNMAVVLSGVILQPFIGKLLDMNFHGMTINGVRAYQVHDYHIAFIALPVCFLIAALMSIIFIKETNCEPAYDINLIRKKLLQTETLPPFTEDLSEVYDAQHSIKHFYF
ncbi:MAG: MFS transporter [Gammaproteobacteria bacterium]|jgi:sugar phosphate permease